jgi:hypothetical protein
MAVKANRVQELIYDNVAAKLDTVFSKEGFKYQKSKKRFLRQSGKLDQVISLYPERPAIYYDDDEGQVFLCFQLNAQIEMPAFDKWYKTIAEDPGMFTHRVKNGWLRLRMNVSFDEFTGSDFYTPTDAQRFKSFVSASLAAGRISESQNIDLDIAFESLIPEMIRNFETVTDILAIYEAREYPHSLIHILFLQYNGYTEKAKEAADNSYVFQLNNLKEKLQDEQADDKKSYVSGFQKFISFVRKAGIAEYSNPFEATVSPLENGHTTLDFAPGIRFTEQLRLNIENLDVRANVVNSKGEILLLCNSNHFIKLSPDGQTILTEHKIEPPKGFEKLTWTKAGLLNGSNEFFVNNFIIREDHSILELELPLNTAKKTKYQQYFHIAGIAFCAKKQQYYILYEGFFLTYSKEGIRENAVTVNRTSNGGIYPEKEWLILQHGKQGYGIFNFEGQLISEHEVSGGNHEFALSPDFNFVAFFFYSTKSQLYDLIKGKKHTLWAHPTLVKGYVDTLYNDINHNFGMTRAAFSPDSTYLVGGADHGKYVAWRLPKVERVELIPDPAFIKLLQPETNRIFLNNDGTVAHHEEMKPGIVELEGQRFFVNRGNDITQFHFLDNGDHFLTVLGSSNYVLTWDRQFNNIGHLKLDGQIGFNETAISIRTNKELIIYKRGE